MKSSFIVALILKSLFISILCSKVEQQSYNPVEIDNKSNFGLYGKPDSII